MFLFGSGNLWAIPTIDISGAAVTSPTPVPFGTIQEVTLDLANFSIKELYGQYQYPVDVARGTNKPTAKAKVGTINAALFNLCFGETPAAGEQKVSLLETGAIPATPGPYTITVANAATFLMDLGVKFTATGVLLTRVAAAPSTGQYSVAEATGIYTFAAADQALGVKISYIYTTAAAPGKVFTIQNRLLGQDPYFKTVFYNCKNAKGLTVTMNRALSSKVSAGTKQSDYTIPEIDFAFMADDAGNVGTFSFAE